MYAMANEEQSMQNKLPPHKKNKGRISKLAPEDVFFGAITSPHLTIVLLFNTEHVILLV